MDQRVFGIGLNKTGTSSLWKCFLALYLHPVASLAAGEARGLVPAVLEHGDYEPALQFARGFRSFQDRPWNIWEMYQHLDERYPGSRFILTVRDPQRWWRSVERWVSLTKPWMANTYRIHLRASAATREPMTEGFLRYNQQVIDYFGGRDDLLVIDFEREDGWAALCGFLDLPRPPGRFPHANRQFYDERDIAKSERIRKQDRSPRARLRRLIRKLAQRK